MIHIKPYQQSHNFCHRFVAIHAKPLHFLLFVVPQQSRRRFKAVLTFFLMSRNEILKAKTPAQEKEAIEKSQAFIASAFKLQLNELKDRGPGLAFEQALFHAEIPKEKTLDFLYSLILENHVDEKTSDEEARQICALGGGSMMPCLARCLSPLHFDDEKTRILGTALHLAYLSKILGRPKLRETSYALLSEWEMWLLKQDDLPKRIYLFCRLAILTWKWKVRKRTEPSLLITNYKDMYEEH